eukprot:2752078-Pyramimonas_sp.AAC.1
MSFVLDSRATVTAAGLEAALWCVVYLRTCIWSRRADALLGHAHDARFLHIPRPRDPRHVLKTNVRSLVRMKLGLKFT